MPATETLLPMLIQSVEIQDLSDLRNYVYETLCDREQLDLGAFPMTERILMRSGSPCGIHFCLHGPRSVKYTAIWETDSHTVLFYGSTGERFHKAQLADASSFATAAA